MNIAGIKFCRLIFCAGLLLSAGFDHFVVSQKIILPLEDQVYFTSTGRQNIKVRTLAKLSEKESVCVWFRLYEDSNQETQATCSKEDSPFFTASGLPVGSHLVALAVLTNTSGTTVVTSVISTRFLIKTQPQNIFLPSYTWDLVSESVAVPPGLEIQLPLDGQGQKIARIPSKWRMQKYIENGPKQGYFRFDVYPETTVSDILSGLCQWSKLHLLDKCEGKMELFGQRVDPFLSSSELDLFNNQAELKFSVIEIKKSDDEYGTDVSDGGTDGGTVDDSYHQKIISTAAADATNEV